MDLYLSYFDQLQLVTTMCLVCIGASAFDIEYAQWFDDHQRLIYDMRAALNSNLSDCELRLLVEGVMSHYDEIFRLKSTGAKLDVFHVLFGMWKTPVERCFLWLGGFRCSEILKVHKSSNVSHYCYTCTTPGNWIPDFLVSGCL